MNNSNGQPFFDVSRPGATAANPGSKPVIPNSPLQPDPMMSAPQAPANPTASIQIPITQSNPDPAPTPDTAAISNSEVNTPVQSTTAVQFGPPAEAVHPLQRQEAFFGEVGKRPKGKKLLFIVLLLVVLSGLGAAGFMYWQNEMKKTESPAPITSQSASEDEQSEQTSAKLFTSKNGGFSIDNQFDWKVEEKDTTAQSRFSEEDTGTYAKVTFTINDNQFLVFDINPGGRGGDCPPAANDKPFAQGNNCPSQKVTKVTKLPSANFPQTLLGKFTKDVYLTNFEYMKSGDDQTIFKLVGLSGSALDADGNLIGEPKPNEGEMGLYVGFTVLSIQKGYVDTKIVDKDDNPTQLSDEDLTKVETVLKTFKLTASQ